MELLEKLGFRREACLEEAFTLTFGLLMVLRWSSRVLYEQLRFEIEQSKGGSKKKEYLTERIIKHKSVAFKSN